MFIYAALFAIWYVCRHFSFEPTNSSLCTKFHAFWVSLFVLAYGVRILHAWARAYNLPRGTWRGIGSKDIALVTGGAAGLGKEIVQQLLQRGVEKVIVLDKNEVENSDKRVEFLRVDVGNEAELKDALSSILARLSAASRHISICINNAGTRHWESLLNLPEDRIRSIFDVNCLAQIWTLRAVLLHHIERVMEAEPGAQIAVVLVSSVLGVLGPRNLLVYSASKAAVTQVHELLVQELKHLPSVRLLLVVVGQLATGMFLDVAPSRQFFAPIVSPQKLAEAIVGRINSGETGVVCEPLYTGFLPLVKVMPVVLQDWCRRFSHMDEKIVDPTHKQ